MANEIRIVSVSTIQRALGIIEGVMLVADEKSSQALATAVAMIDNAMKEVFEYGE